MQLVVVVVVVVDVVVVVGSPVVVVVVSQLVHSRWHASVHSMAGELHSHPDPQGVTRDHAPAPSQAHLHWPQGSAVVVVLVVVLVVHEQ